MYLISTGKQRAAKASRIKVGQTILAFSSWDVKLNINDLVTVNFTSYLPNATPQPQSFDEGISGVLGADLTFGGDWDAGTNPYGDPPGLYPRDDLATVAFYENVTDNTSYAFPYVRLRAASNGAAIDQKVTFSCSGKNQGSFSIPTISV